MKIFRVINLILFLFSGSITYAEIPEKYLKYVMPSADSFTPVLNKLPHYKAYKEKKLVGICYLSMDITPEYMAYNGPINILIGLKKGRISGIKVLEHVENNMEALFIEKEAFDKMYRGKNINDSFMIKKDVDNITGATITTEVIAEIIRASSLMMHWEYFEDKKTKKKL